MELGDKPAQEIDLQTAHMIHTPTGICNTLENSNVKQEPVFYRHADHAKFSEHAICSGNVATITDIKTEVIGSDDYHSGHKNNVYGPKHSDSIIGDQITDTHGTYIKPEPEDERHVTEEFVIEIDTCKDEYCEKYGYPTNCVNVNLHNSEQNGGRTLCVIDTEPCSVGLTDVINIYPDIIKQRAVHIHEPGPTGVIDGPLGASATDLPRQAKSIKTNKAHVCKVCGAAFRDKWALNSHTLIHTGEKPHACPVCGVGFTLKGHLKTHMRIHTGEKPHKCSLCAVSFTQRNNVTGHMRIHTGEKPYTCTVCGVGFAHTSHLKRHTMKHTGEKPHVCSVCGVGFTQKSDLRLHMRIHMSEKPHKCSVCDVSFARKQHLTAHIRTHTGEKPYKCSVCGVVFTQKCNMKTHMRIHTGEKPHKCSVCDVSFTRKELLANHIRTHTGEKPYKCSVCGVGFAQKVSLETHTRTLHWGEASQMSSM